MLGDLHCVGGPDYDESEPDTVNPGDEFTVYGKTWRVTEVFDNPFIYDPLCAIADDMESGARQTFDLDVAVGLVRSYKRRNAGEVAP